MHTQLRLDVTEFGREAAQLGVDISSADAYQRLREVVEATSDSSAENIAAAGGETH